MRTTIWTTLIVDLALPIAGYYLLRACGVGELAALAVGAALPAGRVVFAAIGARHLDAIAAVVLCFFAISLLALLVGDDARIALAFNSVPTGLLGLWCFGSLVFGRPVAFSLILPLLTGGNREQEPFWRQAWDDGPTFRHSLRMITIGWGCLLLAEALIRLALIWAVPVDALVGISNGLQVALVVLFLGFTGWHAKSTGLGIGRYLKSIDQEPGMRIDHA